MRFHYGESMTSLRNYTALAIAAEERGFAGFTIPDSLFYPMASDTTYSYTDDGGREFLENKPFAEPFVLAAAMGAVTSKLELTTNVVKLPVRPPVYSAKLASSIAGLTNDRFNFGVGLSVWPEDYAMMGVPYERRGRRFDECLEIVAGLCKGGYFEFHGEFYDIAPIKLNPVPDKPLPLLIGGHSDAALKRAARHDGWMCAGGTTDQLESWIRKLNGFRAEAGTLDRPFRIFATAMGEVDADMVKRNADLGITDMPVVFRNLYAVEEDSQTLSEKIVDLSRFADRVISRL